MSEHATIDDWARAVREHLAKALDGLAMVTINRMPPDPANAVTVTVYGDEWDTTRTDMPTRVLRVQAHIRTKSGGAPSTDIVGYMLRIRLEGHGMKLADNLPPARIVHATSAWHGVDEHGLDHRTDNYTITTTL